MSTDAATILRVQYPEWAELCASGGEAGHQWMLDPYQQDLIKSRNVVHNESRWSDTASPAAIERRKEWHAYLISAGVRTGGEPPPLAGVTVEKHHCRFCGGTWVTEYEEHPFGADMLSQRWQPPPAVAVIRQSTRNLTYDEETFRESYPKAYRKAKRWQLRPTQAQACQCMEPVIISERTLREHLKEYHMTWPPNF